MPEPTLSDIAATLENHTKRFDQLDKSLSDLKASLAATDDTVTALYTDLVGTTPNVRHRLHGVEHNVHKLIEITPGAGELRQPIYDSGD